MKALIVEDDLTSRLVLQKILAPYGGANVAVNGQEAVEAFRIAMEAGEPYDFVCLDIMMPEMDGQEALKEMRRIEEKSGILLGEGAKVVMTTALGDSKSVMAAFRGQCDAYLVKPIDKAKLVEHLKTFGMTE